MSNIDRIVIPSGIEIGVGVWRLGADFELILCLLVRSVESMNRPLAPQTALLYNTD